MVGSPYEYRIIAAREPSRKNSRFYSPEERIRLEKVEAHFKMLRKVNPNAIKGRTKPFKQAEWKKRGGYKYKLLITNSKTETPVEIMSAYNKRGNAEKQFAAMKNDFGWRLPPFAKMEENTVFMIISAIANNVFRGVVKRYHKILNTVRLETQLRDFTFVFVSVICEYLGNNIYDFHNPDFRYQKLME